jgi:putative transposase
MDEIQQALADGLLMIEAPDQARIMELDPSDLSKKARAVYDFWAPYFTPLLMGERRDQLLEEHVRVDIMSTLAEEVNKPLITVRRMLYRVLRAGRSLRGLGPNFRARGGPGKPQTKGTAKRGRKALAGSATSHVALPEVRTILEATVRDRVKQNGESVDGAYYKMLAERFTDKIVEPNGVITRRSHEESRLPTLRQFRCIAKMLSVEACSKSRTALKNARPGTAKDGIPGPGYLYEIDATGGRLELTSEFSPGQLIGSANAYGLLDVWSTACVGGAMGAFNASYRAAQVALFNTFTSKSELCARWDIDIVEEDWPCHHVPRFITSDRGELVSDASEALPVELNVVARTAAAYRPEMKGTIERWFRDLKAGDIRKLVGFGRKEHRGERNPKDQAALTRYDAMRVFLLLAVRYNHQPAPLSAILEQGYETISRITLWQWGMRHLVSGARIEDPRVIYTALLRKVDASIRENGLFVEGIRYMSPALRTSGLLQRAAQNGAQAVQATVDDFAAKVVWYRTGLDEPWLPAYLADERLLMYDATFTEVAEFYRQCRNVRHRTRVQSAIHDLSTENGLKEISKSAIARQGGNTKASKKKVDIRAARAVDAQDERREHGSQVVGSYVEPARRSKRVRTVVQANAVEQARLNLARKTFLKTGNAQ